MSTRKQIYGLIFGQTIKDELSRQHVTNLRLAEHCRVTPTAVSTWLKGTLPSLENVLQVVDFLDVSLDRVFGRTPGTVDALRKVRRETAAVLDAIDCVLPEQSIVEGARREIEESTAREGTRAEKRGQGTSEDRAKRRKRKKSAKKPKTKRG